MKTDDQRELAAKMLAGIKYDYCPYCSGVGECYECHECDSSGTVRQFTGNIDDLERLLRAIAEPKEI